MLPPATTFISGRVSLALELLKSACLVEIYFCYMNLYSFLFTSANYLCILYEIFPPLSVEWREQTAFGIRAWAVPDRQVSVFKSYPRTGLGDL